MGHTMWYRLKHATPFFYEEEERAGEMTQQIPACGASLDLSLVPGAQMVKEDNWLPKVAIWPPHLCVMVCATPK